MSVGGWPKVPKFPGSQHAITSNEALELPERPRRIAIAGGEAEMLSDFKGSLAAYKLSPDGKTVAFTGYEPPADEEKNKKEKRDWRVVDSNPANLSLYLIPSEAGEIGRASCRERV